MQIGFDVGATKIESVVLDKEGTEHFRERRDCPKNYSEISWTLLHQNHG